MAPFDSKKSIKHGRPLSSVFILFALNYFWANNELKLSGVYLGNEPLFEIKNWKTLNVDLENVSNEPTLCIKVVLIYQLTDVVKV